MGLICERGGCDCISSMIISNINLIESTQIYKSRKILPENMYKYNHTDFFKNFTKNSALYNDTQEEEEDMGFLKHFKNPDRQPPQTNSPSSKNFKKMGKNLTQKDKYFT
ncbi:hypothetical protein ACOSP7_032732 [Xanthoceras sorbifolium]